MKKLISTLAIVAFLFTTNINAQEVKPKDKKECTKDKKECDHKDKKTCTKEEMKSCDKSKKAGCCAAKKA